MTALYERQARLVAGTLDVSGLRTQFKATKTGSKEPNTCQVSVFNLSPEHRGTLRGQGTRVILEAGYVGTVAQIFSGDARLITHEHIGPDWLTRIECGDGERSYQFKNVSLSFRPGTKVADAFAKVAEATELDVAAAVAKVRATLREEFTQGYSAFGRASAELDRLLKGRDLEWSIQDGRLQVLGKTDTTQGAISLSAATGLIGSPQFGSAEKKGGPNILKAKALLQPSLRPGSRVRIDSTEIKGDFKITRLTHSGDTHGGEWYTEIEGLSL